MWHVLGKWPYHKEIMAFIENIVEFERWLDKMLRDAKEKLNMTDETIAWILLREGTACYFRTIGRREINSPHPEKP